MKKIWAEGGYGGELVNWVKDACGWTLEIVEKLGNRIGFQVLLKRWIVECTLGWLTCRCRLSRDHERLPETGEAFISVAMIRLMTRRLASGVSFKTLSEDDLQRSSPSDHQAGADRLDIRTVDVLFAACETPVSCLRRPTPGTAHAFRPTQWANHFVTLGVIHQMLDVDQHGTTPN
ncbi:MAG: transposase [Anaerolineales bacterium]|nr:transposase [Anaerolineales bacterium]